MYSTLNPFQNNLEFEKGYVEWPFEKTAIERRSCQLLLHVFSPYITMFSCFSQTNLINVFISDLPFTDTSPQRELQSPAFNPFPHDKF